MNDPAPSPANTEQLRDQVFSARLEAIEARMDGRIASLEATINALIRRIEERFAQVDARFAQVEARMSNIEATVAATRNAIGGLRTTIVVTAIGAVSGVAAFNATVLSNMLASFESGRNVSEAQARIQRQAEETAALLRQIQQGLPNK
jgi:archaellum component FlaC